RSTAPSGPHTHGRDLAVVTTAQRPPTLAATHLNRLTTSHTSDPHALLGPHPGADGVRVRVLRPLADAVRLTTPTGQVLAELDHQGEGVFTGTLPGTAAPDYRGRVHYGEQLFVY